MANTFKFGNENWAVKDGSALAYNDENNNFKPLPFDFTRASSATTLNRQGLIETVPSGKPRIDFTDNTDGHLLLEPSRTNFLSYSEDFSNWALNGDSISETSSKAFGKPIWTLTESSSSFQGVFISATGVTIGTITASVLVRASASDLFRLRFGATTNKNVDFNLSSGTVTSGSSGANGTINSYGDGWYLCTMSVTATSSTQSFAIYTNSGSVDVIHAQLEAGSYATSYIPTEGSSATRIAETGIDCLLPNETIINNSTATVYLEFEALVNDLSNRWISFEELGVPTDNMFEIRLSAGSNLLQIVTRSSGGGQDVVMSETLTDITANNKIAVNYNGLNWKLAVNGTIADTETAARLFNDNIEKIKFSRNTNTNHFYGKVKDLKVYNTALTDTELQNLTS